MIDTTVQFGLIGAGRIGRIHAENIATRVPGIRLAAIADVNRQAAEQLAERWQVSKIVTDYREILTDHEITAVVICSATDTHARIIQEAAAADKHIFCEKPIDHDLDRIDTALQAVDRAGVKLQVGFNRRFDSNALKVRRLVDEGRIGTPQLLRITSRDPAPPPLSYIKVSGGMFLDMTIHDLDMARYLMGSEITEVFAMGGVMVDPAIGQVGDIDTAIITLRFANGAYGTIDNSRQAVYGFDQRLEMFGSAGMVMTGNKPPDTHTFSDRFGVHKALPLYFFLERYAESFVSEIEQFATSIQQETPPPVTGSDGRIAVVLGLAAQRSLRENRPVKLDD